MMSFTDCHTAADCKKRYRQLAIKLHPDKTGGSDFEFKEMVADYEARLYELEKKAETEAEYKDNLGERIKLAELIWELFKTAKPEYNDIVKMAVATPAISALTTILNGYFPKQAQKVNNILKILQ